MNTLSNESLAAVEQVTIDRDFLFGAFNAAREIGWPLDERLVETIAQARLKEAFGPASSTIEISRGLVKAGMTLYKLGTDF